MAKHRAETWDAQAVEEALHAAGLKHLRTRRRGDLVVIESGPANDVVAHARLRRETVHLWRLEIATHTGRFETTPIRGQRDDLVQSLIDDFGWTLTDIFADPERTSDLDH